MGEDVDGTTLPSELSGVRQHAMFCGFMRLLLLAGEKDDSILAKTAGVGGPHISRTEQSNLHPQGLSVGSCLHLFLVIRCCLRDIAYRQVQNSSLIFSQLWYNWFMYRTM